MPVRTTLWQRFRYWFDNFMSRGGSSIFISLVTVFLVLLITIFAVRAITKTAFPGMWAERANAQDENNDYLQHLYITFLQMTDPGNMAQDIESKPLYKFVAILAGLTGVIMLSMLIAFITTALDQKIAQLKKGHSKVIEEDHTLILGWNERITEILRELVIANESEKSPVVVILSPRDKEWMDDYLKLNFPDSKNTRIVTRSGTVSSLVNLEIVSLNSCKSVVLLAHSPVNGPESDKVASDTAIIKTALALIASRPPERPLNIVAEVFYQSNREILHDISPDEISTIDTSEILAKILVQTSRSVGLSVVYSEILSFDGCEMYFHEADWRGIQFGELCYYFPDGIPMGIKRADGEILINPAIDTGMNDGDSILILAEDDSTIDFQQSKVAEARSFELAGGRKELQREKNLVIGWTPKVPTILREYADYVLAGSEIYIMLRIPDDSVAEKIEKLNEELDELSIRFLYEDPLSKEGLLAADPFQFDNIIILSQGGKNDDFEQTDSETILILLMLRQIFDANQTNQRPIKLITEILDSENQALVAQTGVNDFIISNRFVSMVLAQISEDPDIKTVYDDLFSEDGSEIYLKSASLYFKEFPVEVTYADMIRIAQSREEVCLGVKIKSLEKDMAQNFGVKLIPPKGKKYTLQADDALVVLAEDET